jgi:hypothetical protein
MSGSNGSGSKPLGNNIMKVKPLIKKSEVPDMTPRSKFFFLGKEPSELFLDGEFGRRGNNPGVDLWV